MLRNLQGQKSIVLTLESVVFFALTRLTRW